VENELAKEMKGMVKEGSEKEPEVRVKRKYTKKQ
jgi:hypothetical protein